MDEMISPELKQYLEAIVELIEAKATTVQEAAEIVRNKKSRYKNLPLFKAADSTKCVKRIEYLSSIRFMFLYNRGLANTRRDWEDLILQSESYDLFTTLVS